MPIALSALLLLQATVAPCTAPAPPPAGLEAWTAAETAPGSLAIGKARDLALSAAATITYALAPERAPGAGTFGIVVPLSVDRAGTYRVALGAGAWIDVVRDGRALTSVTHMEGPACSGIRKIVDFALEPGTYAIQLSGARAATLRILVAPAAK